MQLTEGEQETAYDKAMHRPAENSALAYPPITLLCETEEGKIGFKCYGRI